MLDIVNPSSSNHATTIAESLIDYCFEVIIIKDIGIKTKKNTIRLLWLTFAHFPPRPLQFHLDPDSRQLIPRI